MRQTVIRQTTLIFVQIFSTRRDSNTYIVTSSKRHPLRVCLYLRWRIFFICVHWITLSIPRPSNCLNNVWFSVLNQSNVVRCLKWVEAARGLLGWIHQAIKKKFIEQGGISYESQLAVYTFIFRLFAASLPVLVSNYKFLLLLFYLARQIWRRFMISAAYVFCKVRHECKQTKS